MNVLITLGDVEIAVRLNALLEADADLRTEVVSPLDDVRGVVRRFRPDVVVMTGALMDPGNVSLVRMLQWDGVPVIGLADLVEPALEARLRAIGFAEVVAKPARPEEVAEAVHRQLHWVMLTRETGLVGASPAIREVLVKVEQIAPVSSTVLIEGESGTGKELVARAIHRLSRRKAKPFIAVNIGALPETLLESELFGHEKGAFTGAAERRLGRFELADTGTIFLDEIGELTPAAQVRLLRVLEEREVTRLGGTQPIPVDVRVVAATNRSLREQIERGEFRSDLYFRLNVLSMYLPPLRERREDIPLLVRRYVQELSGRHDREFQGISAEAMEILVGYAWPGNVRELRNLVESMVVLAPGREIGPEDIPREIREARGGRFLPVHVGPVVRGAERAQGQELEFIVRSLVELKLQVEELRRRVDEDRAAMGAVLGMATGVPGAGVSVGIPGAGAGQWLGELRAGGLVHPFMQGIAALEPRDAAPPPNTVTIMPGMTMAEIERAAIEAALKETRGNRRKAAELLGIGERTMYRKLREYQLDGVGGAGGDAGDAGDAGEEEREGA